MKEEQQLKDIREDLKFELVQIRDKQLIPLCAIKRSELDLAIALEDFITTVIKSKASVEFLQQSLRLVQNFI